MKKTITTLLFILVAMTSLAQDICAVKATADDYIKLLNAQGLYAYSSYWYDPDDKICRNCDATELGADYMNSNTFKASPHIYVFGIKIWKL